MATIKAYDTKAGRRYRVPDGKQTDKRGFTTMRDATTFLNSVEVSKLDGSYVDPAAGRATIGELGEKWLARQSHLKPSSLHPIESAWRIHVEPKWAEWQVSAVKRDDVAD